MQQLYCNVLTMIWEVAKNWILRRGVGQPDALQHNGMTNFKMDMWKWK